MKKLTIVIASLVALSIATVAIVKATSEATIIVSFFIIFNPFMLIKRFTTLINLLNLKYYRIITVLLKT